MCPTCHTTLDQSDSAAAQRIEHLHPAADRRSARPQAQIKAELVANFGAGHPRRAAAQGLRPARVVAAARRGRSSARSPSRSASGAGAARAAPTSRRRASGLDDETERRLDELLARLD